MLLLLRHFLEGLEGLEEIDIQSESIVNEYVTFSEQFEGCPIPFIDHYMIGAGAILEDDLENYSATVLGGAICTFLPKAHAILQVILGGACAAYGLFLQRNIGGSRLAFGFWDDHAYEIPIMRAGAIARYDIDYNDINAVVDVLYPNRVLYVAGHTMQDIL